MKKDLCQCGKEKDRRALVCRECRDKEASNRPCKGCGRSLPFESYCTRPNANGGVKRRARCKECEATASVIYRQTYPDKVLKTKREYAKQNPDKVRRWGFRSTWKKKGYDPGVVEAFILSRPKQCAICGTTRDYQALGVDHCHTTMKLRGLLCSNCNTGLGQFQDNPTLLRLAADYLERNS